MNDNLNSRGSEHIELALKALREASRDLQAPEQMRDAGITEVDGRQIDHDWTSAEKAGRSSDRGVDLEQPVHDWNRRNEYERDV